MQVYDPTMADRSMLPPTNSRMQQMMDLGFDDANMHPEMEEKYSQLAEQLDSRQHCMQPSLCMMSSLQLRKPPSRNCRRRRLGLGMVQE